MSMYDCAVCGEPICEHYLEHIDEQKNEIKRLTAIVAEYERLNDKLLDRMALMKKEINNLKAINEKHDFH